MPIRYWRASTGPEVDFILGEKDLALEIKSGRVHEGDLRGLRALQEDGPVRRTLLVCTEKEPRKLEGNIEILPWRVFLDRLWGGELV